MVRIGGILEERHVAAGLSLELLDDDFVQLSRDGNAVTTFHELSVETAAIVKEADRLLGEAA